MPRRTYTADQKQAALDHVMANNGDIRLSAVQLDIPYNTLLRWVREANLQFTNRFPLSPSPSSPPSPSISPSLLAERGQGGEVSPDLHALRDLIIRLSLRLGSSIEEAIPSAALPERIAAFTQVLDRAGKLGIRLPSEQIEYVLTIPDDVEEDLDGEVNDYEDEITIESTDSAHLPESCDSE